ncbi:hypothetical protein COCMIDRAFT_29781 [Bipolaris oryzae ATCC 44560]|uniref:Uncharacterized protein n=1 Tax=Bipolaris oryzae ATCC 44560 TaxID=930090 RepID=W6YPX9_COCMI|nr:uncharacterized protein COCMIDRAFT_29781 [Bipolaris oryzae ATCC 44560]EUC41452.1 hypothetical protein COCMIDRAFT_29781 [Bipolaris oryzae ATCC 44560]
MALTGCRIPNGVQWQWYPTGQKGRGQVEDKSRTSRGQIEEIVVALWQRQLQPVRCDVDDGGHGRYLAGDGQLRPVSMSASDGAEVGTGVGVGRYGYGCGSPTRVSVGLAHLLRQARPRSETVPALQNYSGVVILSTTATQPGLPTINPLPAPVLPPSPDAADNPYSLIAHTAYFCRPSPACLPTPPLLQAVKSLPASHSTGSRP